ncbi:MAG: ribonuclease HII [Deltaproteobacteria bacterium]|nr:ribonuclease HII [Deltaproteobacteria bacterium]MBW2068042.1 ribonuclease HII [Deltaproteobacteria bacterium]
MVKRRGSKKESSSVKTQKVPSPVLDLYEFDEKFQNRGFKLIAGIDEAGRGPLAGPVVAAAVVYTSSARVPDGINDSKRVKESQRKVLFQEILNSGAFVGIGYALPYEIDSLNILRATLLAMSRALSALPLSPDLVLVDGNYEIPCGKNLTQIAIIGGDRKSLAIASASIIAKVFRDRVMILYDRLYPEYGFAKHKGYPTKQHIEALKKYGPCPIHRESFRTVRQCSEKAKENSQKMLQLSFLDKRA